MDPCRIRERSSDVDGGWYFCVQPDNTALKDYGRLLKDGELKIRAHSDNRTKTRLTAQLSSSCSVQVHVEQHIGTSY